MQLETFRGPDLKGVVRQVRQVIGDDAMIVRSGTVKTPNGDLVEIVAARPAVIAAFRANLGADILDARTKRIRPYIIALVGPSGAGKTSAAVKIALSPIGVGSGRVGLLSLDTHRVGAITELQTYAEIAGLPLEVVYNRFQVAEALKRLRDVDVIIVDTAGRLTNDAGSGVWAELLERIGPDEVHLVMPAGLRNDVSKAYLDRFSRLRVTHVLMTKLDDVPVDSALLNLVESTGLPGRWVSHGPAIPSDLSPAGPRLLASLGAGRYDAGMRPAG